MRQGQQLSAPEGTGEKKFIEILEFIKAIRQKEAAIGSSELNVEPGIKTTYIVAINAAFDTSFFIGSITQKKVVTYSVAC
ncbi:MAG: hypothetical protein R2940_16120 [Syntrophotaleaceae bacterium]